MLVLLGSLLMQLTHADVPRLIDGPNGVRDVDLGRSVAAALRAHDPQFRMLAVNDLADPVVQLIDPEDQPPFATIGDFNGDGRADVIVMGLSHDEVVIYGVVSNESARYDVHFIRRATHDPDGVNLVLTLVENKRRRPRHEGRSVLRFDEDAFQIGRVDAHPALLHFVDGHFVRESR